MGYPKDKEGINQRRNQKNNLQELAEIVSKSNYADILLSSERPEYEYQHKDKHDSCTFSSQKDDPKIITEKRICRCWNYYNKDIHKEKCLSCPFGFTKTNKGEIAILDYEVPTKYNMEKLGGIDWLLSDGTSRIAAEVKPPKGPETLVRMIAEILTYTIGTNYVPAICFFKTQYDGKTPSMQMTDYMKYKDTADFISIKNKTGLKVLYITFDDTSFAIHDTEKEPLL